MRCPDCNKMVSMDLQDPEGNVEVSADGLVEGDVRIVRVCADCGTELKEATFSVELDLTAQVAEHRKTCSETDLSVEAEWSPYEDVERKDRHGKAITNPRYQKSLYGAEASITVTCACGEEFTGDWQDSVAASAMDELV